ncbi:MAG: hypothetical protein KDB21_08680 [Acidimicrobiales bacterium]|nr:hypothetical protein [Acidimicrobiales bacterium]
MTTRVVNTHEARIVPLNSVRPTRMPGAWAGRVEGSDDAVAPDDDVIALFDDSARTAP